MTLYESNNKLLLADGKALKKGEGGGGEISTCNLTIDVQYANNDLNIYVPRYANGQRTCFFQRCPVGIYTITDAVCDDFIVIDTTYAFFGTTLAGGVAKETSYLNVGEKFLFKLPSTPGAVCSITLYDDD